MAIARCLFRDQHDNRFAPASRSASAIARAAGPLPKISVGAVSAPTHHNSRTVLNETSSVGVVTDEPPFSARTTFTAFAREAASVNRSTQATASSSSVAL